MKKSTVHLGGTQMKHRNQANALTPTTSMTPTWRSMSFSNGDSVVEIIGEIFDTFEREFSNIIPLFSRPAEELWTITPKDFDNPFKHSFPRTDIVEFNDRLEFQLAVPGLSIDELNIAKENDYIVISGKKAEQMLDVTKSGKYIRNELKKSAFTRRFCIANMSDTFYLDNISASLKNGILHVKLPRKEVKPVTEKPPISPVSIAIKAE